MADEQFEHLDSIRAAERVANSTRLRAFASWIIAAVILPCAGWITAKLDTKAQVDNLSHEVTQLRGSVSVLTSQQRDLVQSIKDLSNDNPERPGPLFVQLRELKFAARLVVGASAMALAGENYGRQRFKRDEAERLMSRYDYRLQQGELAAEAAANVIAQVAVK